MSTNAIEHGDPSLPVEVLLEELGASVELRVRNWGEPIPPELLPFVFDPYQRGPSAPSRGLGLGLFIAEQIAVAHGGTIAVRSTKEEGTMFVVSLPRRRAEVRAVAPAATPERAPA